MSSPCCCVCVAERVADEDSRTSDPMSTTELASANFVMGMAEAIASGRSGVMVPLCQRHAEDLGGCVSDFVTRNEQMVARDLGRTGAPS